MNFDYKTILKKVRKKNFWSRSIIFVIGVFIVALAFNVFLQPNKLIPGGISGLSIITEKVFDIEPGTFILIANSILIMISFIFLGKYQTTKTILGSILYPVFLELTAPFAPYIVEYLQFENFLLLVLIASLVYGFGYGLIYKTGFTTGGSDILIQLCSKYLKMPMGKANIITSVILLACGGVVFGLDILVYSIIIIYISTIIMDKLIIGVSQSKMFYIYTNEQEKIKEVIIRQLNTGVTFLNVKGGFSNKESKMIMCVIPTKDYFIFKETILAIDPKAFFVISDCYEARGGVKRSNLPFINLD